MFIDLPAYARFGAFETCLLRVLPEATVREMLSWPHGGFSLDGGTYVEAQDRASLERLLLYVLRPALSLKQLTYAPDRTSSAIAPPRASLTSARAWAACLKKVFEVSPVLCVKCGGVMVLTALIRDDRELDRILVHQGWPADFPKASPARAPPAPAADQDEAGQADPCGEQWDARQDWPAGDWPA